MDRKIATPDPVALKAIQWMVHLASGEASADDHQAFRQWRQENSVNDAAAIRLEQSLGLLNNLSHTADLRSQARRVLVQPVARRQLLKGTLGIGALALGGGLIMQRHHPLPDWFADVSTGTAQRKQLTLPDGSHLWLNARSAVDLHFDRTRHLVALRAGEIILNATKPDTTRLQQHPLILNSAHTHIEAGESHLLVRQNENDTLVSVLHAEVRVSSYHHAPLVLKAGDSMRFSKAAIQAENLAPETAVAWKDGFIELHDQPLADVITALRAYRSGFLCISPAAAQLRVTGSFSLDDTDKTLRALVDVLPVRVIQRTPYWVSIDLHNSYS